jgi:FkbM family methyltransferase
MDLVKKTITKIFGSIGLQVTRKPNIAPEKFYSYHRNEAMLAGLYRCSARSEIYKTIIDVGAAAGSWSQTAAEVWPSASFVLFEPLDERAKELESLVNENKNFNYVNHAAGSSEGIAVFNVSDDLDGSGISDATNKIDNVRTVKVSRIDDVVNSLNLHGPYLIKLDTHGFEVPIIEGCSGIIDEVGMFIIECYGFQIADKSLLFWEMCEYMDTKGFRLIDIVDIMHRPGDNAFWQCDAFFAKKTLPLFQNNSYA